MFSKRVVQLHKIAGPIGAGAQAASVSPATATRL